MGLMRDKDDLAKEYIECYKRGINVKKLRFPKDTEYNVLETLEVFKLKQGLPVKYISTKDILSLPMDDQLIGYDGFYRSTKGFYLIPNEYKNKIISFVLRGIKHRYFDIPLMSPIKPMFGWYRFIDYKQGEPIIIVEGAKDCIILQQYYPYVLATLTANITEVNMNILDCMTNKIILGFDNDKTGVSSTSDQLKKLKNRGFKVAIIKAHGKDFGNDYRNSNYLQELITKRLMEFKQLERFFKYA